MSANPGSCVGDERASCWTVPAEFVRLRYFFGQRLGVVDLSDEQGYVVGKQRFHAMRAHGAGVLCGLAVERYLFPAGTPPTTPTTLLLVHRGAALDDCGREIVVGWDQCIDVAAWYRQNVASKPELQAWSRPDFTGERRLDVCVRYRECPSDPSPAPRDPCGCEAASCEFGRVREGFELALMTPAEADAVCLRRTPPGAAPRPLESPALGGGARAYWQLLLAGDCREPRPDAWLCLASFTVDFDPVASVVLDVTAPDNAIPDRLALLSTALLQDTIAAALVGDGGDALLGPGPAITSLVFVGSGTTAGELRLPVALVDDGGLASPLAPAATGPAAAAFELEVFRFHDDGTWEDVTPPASGISYAVAQQHFVVSWPSGLIAGGRYRITFATGDAAPIVDLRMRPLSPRRFARHFRLIDVAGTLTLAANLYDA